MANFCYSELSCEKEVLDSIIKNYVKDGAFDFNAIIPTESRDKKEEKWGTKWYPEDVKRISENTIIFSTPWSPPRPIIYKLAELYNEHEINIDYHEEVYSFSGKESIKCEGNKLKIKGFYEDKDEQRSLIDKEVVINGQLENSLADVTEEKSSVEIEIARKAGYVQGVCECVAAIGDDHTLGKKLLTEMNVTKDMAKKFANPETYKALEQGIFAPQQKIEQTHSMKL